MDKKLSEVQWNVLLISLENQSSITEFKDIIN